MNQCPQGPEVFHLGYIEFCRKIGEIFANECLSPVSITPVISCSSVPATQAIIPCHGFSVIVGVVDTETGDNDTSEQLSPVTTTPVMCFKKIRNCPNGVYSGPTD